MIETFLCLSEDGEGKRLPMTLGAAPAADNHLHLADAGLLACQARIVGSRIASAYAFVLVGQDTFVNGQPLKAIRVLRHADQIKLGQTTLMYLDFVVRQLTEGSRLGDQICCLPSCSKPIKAIKRGDSIDCPWCGQLYHATCWLKMKECATPYCYPIRRMLLFELAGQVKLTTMPNVAYALRRCVAGCNDSLVIEPEEDILRCPNPACDAPYHPGCWLAMRARCRECSAEPGNIPGLINKLIFRLEEPHRR